jgi:signal transduction histidine kinase
MISPFFSFFKKEETLSEDESAPDPLLVSNNKTQSYLQLLRAFSVFPKDRTHLRQTLNEMLISTIEFIKMDSFALYINKENGGNILQLFIHQGFPTDYIQDMQTITLGRGYSGLVAQQGHLRYSIIQNGDPRFIRHAPEKAGIQTFLSIPIIREDFSNLLIGIVNLGSKKKLTVSNDILQFLKILGNQIANILDNYRSVKLANKREKWTNSLFDLAIVLQSCHSLKEISVIVSEEIRVIFNADYSLVEICDEDSEPKDLGFTGFSSIETAENFAKVLHQILDQTCLEISGRTIQFLFGQDFILINSLCAIRITSISGSPCGCIALCYQDVMDTSELKTFLLRLSSEITAAIANVKLYTNLQEIAVLKERNWIAREMHDSLAQMIASAKVELGKIKNNVQNGQTNDVIKNLGLIDTILEQAYGEIRELILCLHTRVSGEKTFLNGIQSYLNSYMERFNIKVITKIPENINLVSMVEVQLIRIIQEALTNVRKHAKTDLVYLDIAVKNNGIVLNIKDYGCGCNLDSNAARVGHFGLSVMRERAQLVGGTLDIISKPGEGMKIKVFFPLGTY